MLEKEFRYYLDHQNELVELYNDKFIVIVGEEVIGAYDSPSDAYDSAITSHDAGTFLIQHCAPGEGAHTQIFRTRVVV